MTHSKRKMSTQTLVKIAILAGLATILQMISISSGALLLPPWMKFDLADVPVLIAGFAMGPLPAVAVALIKNLLGLFTTSTAGVGELANFLICIAFVLPSSILYQKKPNKKTAMIGMGIGIIVMCIVGVLLNYFVLMPLFIRLMFGSPEAFFQVAQGANSIYSSFWNICVFGVIPFNILKGLLESIVCLLIYKPLSRFF